MLLTVNDFVVLSIGLFCIGLFGVIFNIRNFLYSLISVELMLLASTLLFVSFSNVFSDVNGQVFAIIILSLAAAEVAIGLAIFMKHFTQTGNISVFSLTNLEKENV